MIFIYSFLLSIVAFVLPYTGPDVYPKHFITRVCFGMFFVSVKCHPLINDYIRKESRGNAYTVKSFCN